MRQLIERQILEQLSQVSWRLSTVRSQIYKALERAIEHHVQDGKPETSDSFQKAAQAAIQNIEETLSKGAPSLEAVQDALKWERTIPASPLLAQNELFSPKRVFLMPFSFLRQKSKHLMSNKMSHAFARYSVLVLLVGIGVLFLFGGWWFLKSNASPICTLESTECFDSGWQAVSNKQTVTYLFRHNIKALPRQLTLWFSPVPDGSRAFLIGSKFPRLESGNPISVEARPDMVLLHVWSGAPIFGFYDSGVDRWVVFTEGFYRVVALK